jgi:hypothetical protein
LELLKHPFVDNSISVADVLHPLVLQATSMRSSGTVGTEQFDSVLMPKGIPERVEPILSGASGEFNIADESLDANFESVIYRKPVPASAALDATQHSKVDVELFHLDVHDTELSFSRGMSNTSDRPAAHATDDSSINPAAGSQEANVAFESVMYRRPALASASADSRYFEVCNVDLCDTAPLLSKGMSIASDRPVAAAEAIVFV